MTYLALKLHVLAVAVGVSGLATGVKAQPVEKNGFPCVAEVCLGDGIGDLRKIITWERAMSPYGPGGKGQPIGAVQVDALTLKSLRATYPGLPDAAAPYLWMGKFDGLALSALAAVNVACDFKEIEGVFTSSSGHPTTIKMAVAAESNTKQRWAVTTIRRLYPTAVTQEQRGELYQQLKQRYSAWDPLAQPPTTALRFGLQDMGVPGFFLVRGDHREQANMVKQHSACGGAAKINLE
ncbi:MAG: hypothetical protein ACT6S0_17515 [Roseateles sp.]|uniref:hypothetical protein n=1 Tax=Roseateles sp. TaxID=1971397 RepID=UPI0040352151